jgi:hypothetical protein
MCSFQAQGWRAGGRGAGEEGEGLRRGTGGGEEKQALGRSEINCGGGEKEGWRDLALRRGERP